MQSNPELKGLSGVYLKRGTLEKDSKRKRKFYQGRKAGSKPKIQNEFQRKRVVLSSLLTRGIWAIEKGKKPSS